MNLTKEVKDVYSENCNILLKEIKEVSKWKDSPFDKLELLLLLNDKDYPKRSTG